MSEIIEVFEDVMKVEDPIQRSELVLKMYETLSDGPWSEVLAYAEDLSAQSETTFDLSADEQTEVNTIVRNIMRDAERSIPTRAKPKTARKGTAKPRTRFAI